MVLGDWSFLLKQLQSGLKPVGPNRNGDSGGALIIQTGKNEFYIAGSV
ncbi:MAG: DUF5597 domain-containing protein [Cytophagaceae bacterium]|nr:DUF5597 domain-containing protein [Cytophagaceae bacterium]